ncbi:MAG: hypothetical protein LC808_37210 [Actinobacteria bacterium]|nr:hypothetical protein [Actinomycetota bacterium]
MRQLLSVVPYPGEQVGLPAVVEELLADVVADGFTLYCCGPKVAPNALVACYEWYRYVDLLTIRDFDRVITARVPRRGPVNIFAPDVVVWAYEGLSQYALHALLTLVHPEHPNAPIAEYPAPASLHVARAQQRPMTIQLPTPGRARARAARLAAVMTTDGRDRPSMPPCGVRTQGPGWPPVERAVPDARLLAASRPLPPVDEK